MVTLTLTVAEMATLVVSHVAVTRNFGDAGTAVAPPWYRTRVFFAAGSGPLEYGYDLDVERSVRRHHGLVTGRGLFHE